MMDFGPKSDEERRIFAEEYFVGDVQLAIQELLNRKGWTRAELAKRLGVSKASVTQFLGSTANPTVRKLARVLLALDVQARVSLDGPLFCVAVGRPADWTHIRPVKKREPLAPAVPRREQNGWRETDSEAKSAFASGKIEAA